jgi:thioesterase domain-containing protein
MKETLPLLTRTYADEILSVDPAGPFLLGGNCQGGHIAFDVALELLGRGREVTLLLLLEVFRPRPYPGRVALFYGRESERFNPYLQGLSPEEAFRSSYQAHSVDIVPGNHGEYFRAPNLEPFVAALRGRLDEVEATYPSPTSRRTRRMRAE